MDFIKTKIEDVAIIEPKIFFDQRGFFMVCYNDEIFALNGIKDVFIQDNISKSKKGTLRGMHFQLAPYEQAKIVRVTKGEIFDVAIDIRNTSSTYSKWVGVVLNDKNRKALYIPAGFAHGFMVLSEEAEVAYKCTAQYNPKADRSIAWNDPQIGIDWPNKPDLELLSEKDKNAPFLCDANNAF